MPPVRLLPSLNVLIPLLPLLSSVLVNGLTITNDAASIVNKTYDFVIVGGGTSGLTVASRLAEVNSLSILVIEAGTDEQNNTDVNDPQMWTVHLGSRFDWNYTTVPQSVGGGLRSITINAGKILGGSSSINGQEYARGTKDQYDALEKLGNSGWNWNSMLSAMKKSESFHTPSQLQISQGASYLSSAHGFQGPLSVAYPVPYTGSSATQTYLSAASDIIPSLVHSKDVSSGHPNGGNALYFTITPGKEGTTGMNRRSSSATAYIYPSLTDGQKMGLTILTGHFGVGIVWGDSIDGKAGATAVGVKFIKTADENSTINEDDVMFVSVKKEVIVASGALATPHFLELSGIGNRTILEEASIPVQVDLPSVGTNYQDGNNVVQFYTISPSIDVSSIETFNAPGTGASLLLNITQVLTESGARDAISELRKTIKQRAADIVSSGSFTSQAGMEKMLAYQAESIASLNAPVIEMTFFPAPPSSPGLGGAVQFGLLPQQRGTIHTISNNPTVRPTVNPHFLQVPFDLYLLGNSTKITRSIFSTPLLAKIYDSEVAPGLAAVPLNASNEQWQSFVGLAYVSVLKGVGSVSMLPREDGGAVDSNLTVYGTSNVRVVDASVLPIQISAAHLSATVYGIAERAAEIIMASLRS